MRGVRGLVGWRGQGLPFVAGFAVLLLLLGCSRRDEADDVGKLGDVSRRLQAADWPAEHLVVTNSMRFDQRAVYVGSVAVTKAATGQVLAHNAELALEEDARIVGTARADTVYLGARSQITSDASYNSKQGSGTIGGTSTTPLALPLPISVPALPPMSAGTQGVTVPSNAVQTLDAGSYAAVSLTAGNGGSKTKLRLSGGTYTFASLTLATDSRVECDAPCEIRVVGRALVSARSFLGPAATPSIGPGNVQLLVKGNNGGSGPSATPAALTLDNDSSLHAYVVATNGTLSIGHRVSLKGKAVAKDLLLGIDLQGQGLQMPLISQHPSDEEVWEGQTAEFSVAATGPGLTYQWQKNGQNIPGATGSTLQIPMAPVSDDGAQIRVVIRNEAGSVTSNPATLTVIPCQDADLQCDGIDEDCDGNVDEDFVPHCVGSARFTCEGGTEVGRACSNGVFCDGAEGCDAGECTVGTPPEEDNNACTVDQCNEADQSTSNTPEPSGTDCSTPQGSSICNGSGACVPAPVPFVGCVDRIGGGKLSALFGYDNPNSTQLSIPEGPFNEITGSTDASPSIHLKPGNIEGAFWATFPQGTAITWKLGNKTARASAAVPNCEAPASAGPDPKPKGEGAYGHAPGAGPRRPYGALAGASNLVETRSLAVAAGGDPGPNSLSSAVPQMITVRVRVHRAQVLENNDPDLCVGTDLATLVKIGDQPEQYKFIQHCNNHFCDIVNVDEVIAEHTVDLAQGSLPIRFRAIDEDDWWCGGDDDQLFSDTDSFDLNTPGSIFVPKTGSGVLVQYFVEIEHPPADPDPPLPVPATVQLCYNWNPDYIDEGYGEASTGQVPAAYSEYFLRMVGPNQRSQGTEFRLGQDGSGSDPGTPGLPGCNAAGRCFLDVNGCTAPIPGDDLVNRFDDPLQALELEVKFFASWERSRMLGMSLVQQRFEVRRATNPDAGNYNSFASISALPGFWIGQGTQLDPDFPVNGFIVQNGWRIPRAQMRFTHPMPYAPVQAAAMISHALASSDVIPDTLNIPAPGSPPIPIVVGAGSPENSIPATPPFTCTTDTDCAAFTEQKCIGKVDHKGDPVNDASGTQIHQCSCEVATDCAAQQVCLVDNRGPAGKRCGVEMYGSVYQSPKPSVFGGGTPEALFIGPASRPFDAKQCTTHSACIEPGQACINPDGTDCSGSSCWCRWHDQARWKFVNAHELGHLVAENLIGQLSSPAYNFRCTADAGCGSAPLLAVLNDPPGRQNTPCSCDHISSANRLHCLQSLERAHEAFSEGFGHFVATSLYNPRTYDAHNSSQPTGTFVYYKEVLESSGQKVYPPYAVDASGQGKWRNNTCGTSPFVARFGTEHDWLQFLWNWSRRGPNNSPWYDQVLALRQICDPTQCIVGGVWQDDCAPTRCGDTSASYPTRLADGSIQFTSTSDGRTRYVWGTPVPPTIPDEPVDQATYDLFRDDYVLWSQERSFSAGVNAYFNAKANAGDPDAVNRRNHFTEMANTRGVSEVTTP